MKRVALLGATGSIGRQALEIVEAHPELELAAASFGVAADRRPSRRTPRSAVTSPSCWSARSRTSSSTRSSASQASPQRSGRSSAASRSRSPTRRAWSPRRPRARRQGAGRRPAAPRRQRALGGVPVPRGARPGDRRDARPDRVRGAVPRPHARRPRPRHRGGGARAPHVAHGPQDHRRLRDAREQGPRADRGALPLRPRLRPRAGRRPPDLDGARARLVPRRRRAGAHRLPRHARAHLLRPHLSRNARPRRSHRSTSPPA
jgi:hypothetical protein